jgi:hypothetical protein
VPGNGDAGTERSLRTFGLCQPSAIIRDGLPFLTACAPGVGSLSCRGSRDEPLVVTFVI